MTPQIWTPSRKIVLPSRQRGPIKRASFVSPDAMNVHRGFNWRVADSGLATDPFFANVALLMHFDSSTGFLLDSSSNVQLVTQAVPARAVGQGVGKFGDASMDPTLSSPQDNSALITPTAVVNAQNIGVPITWEFWMKVVAAPPTFDCFTQTWERADTTSNTRVILNTTGAVVGLLWGSAVTFSAVSVVGTGFNFYAATVDNVGQARTYFNGVKVSDTGAGAADQPGVAKRVRLGGANAVGTGTGSWQIDDFRLTIGGTNARYTGATCPVPTAAFPNS